MRAIVCPYHSWTYSRQGDLIACHGMHEDLDKSKLGLKPLHTEVCRRADLRVARRLRRPRSHHCAKTSARPPSRRASTARRSPRSSTTTCRRTGSSSGRTTASASTACAAIRSTSRPTSTSTRKSMRPTRSSSRWPRPWRARSRSGRRRASRSRIQHGGLATFPDPDRGLWFAADRTVLADGFDTESMDGKRVAPLMGDYAGRRRRRAADAQHAELLGARELRSRGGRAAAARRSAHDQGARLLAGARGRRRGQGLRPRQDAAVLGVSPTSRTGTSASGSRKVWTRSATSRGRCPRARNTTSTRSSAGTCSRCAAAWRRRSCASRSAASSGR